MMTEEFEGGIVELLRVVAPTDDPTLSPAAADDQDGAASKGGTAIMCAERVYFQCHRMLVSDYLTAQGHTVLHIDDERRRVRQHTLMAEARLVDGKLVYDGGKPLGCG
jgi:hypothetical protein